MFTLIELAEMAKLAVFGCLEKYLFTLFCFQLRKTQKSHCEMISYECKPGALRLFLIYKGTFFHSVPKYTKLSCFSQICPKMRHFGLLCDTGKIGIKTAEAVTKGERVYKEGWTDHA